jgi:hypothetical protein
MSILFKFIDSGFLLTFGLILLISGGIMLYCYRRLNLLEKSVIEHGKILQNFIMNYNIQMQHFSLLNKSMSTSNTTNNVENTRSEYVEFDKVKKINLGEKISVSDNEDEDDEDEEDKDDEDEEDKDDDEEDKDEDDDDDEADDDDDEADDDDDEADDDDDEADDEDDDKDEDDSNEDDDDKNKLENLTIVNNKLEDLEDLITSENIEVNEQTISSFDDETFLKNLPINLDSFTLDNTNSNPKIINLENIQETNDKTGERKNYSKMKVDDLKTLVVTKNLIDNENAQKMKKSDLVKLLQKQ